MRALSLRSVILRAAISTFIACSLASAQVAWVNGPPGGYTFGEHNNGLMFNVKDNAGLYDIICSIDSHNNSPVLTKTTQRLSGNKVEFTVNPTIARLPAGMTDPAHRSVNGSIRLSSFKLRLVTQPNGVTGEEATTLLEDDPGTYAIESQAPPAVPRFVNPSYRIATTQLPHLSNLWIDVSFTITYDYTAGGSTQTDSVAYEHRFPFTVYNKMHVAGTPQGESNGAQAPSFFYEQNQAISLGSVFLVQAAIAAATTLNHACIPTGSDSALYQLRANLLDNRITESTVAVLNLHGHPSLSMPTMINGNPNSGPFSFLADSMGWTQNDWTNGNQLLHVIQNTEIAAQVAAKGYQNATTGNGANPFPRYNFVSAYGLNSATPVSSGSGLFLPFPAAYDIAQSATNGTAFHGFSQVINVSCWEPQAWADSQAAGVADPYKTAIPHIQTKGIQDHGTVLLSRLTTGATADLAKDDADAAFPLVTFTQVQGKGLYEWIWNKTSSSLYGDANTRLFYVYMTNQQYTSIGTNAPLFWIKLS